MINKIDKTTPDTTHTLFTLPYNKEVRDYFYEDKGQIKFSDTKFKNDIKINKEHLKRFNNDFMIFKEGKWEQIHSDMIVKILKKYITMENKKLTYTDNQFKRILDIIEASIDEFPSQNDIVNIQTTSAYKVISKDYIYLIDTTNNTFTIKKELNKGQYYNFVTLPSFNIDIESITNNLDVSHTSNSIIDIFLNDITLQDQSLVMYLQELVAYTMLFGHLEPKIYIGLGSGSNGKSVFASMIKYILGQDNVSSLEFADINQQTATILESNFLNLPTELSSNKTLPENTLKAISDGESIMANEKYLSPRSVLCMAKLFALTNELPNIKDASDGFWRRAVVIPFELKIDKTTAKKQDKNHFNILFKENVELLREWAFIGLLRLIKNKGVHTECKRIHSASRLYMINNNNALMFLEEFITNSVLSFFNEDKIYSKQTLDIKLNSYQNSISYLVNGAGEHSVSLKELYYTYKSWTSDNGYKALSIKNFRHKLQEKENSSTFEFNYEIRKTSEYKVFLDENDFIAINNKNKPKETKPVSPDFDINDIM